MRTLIEQFDNSTAPARRLARGGALRLAGRLPGLRDESGAQAAEYAMLGGVSAAACGGLITILRNPETLSTIVRAVLDTVASLVVSWF